MLVCHTRFFFCYCLRFFQNSTQVSQFTNDPRICAEKAKSTLKEWEKIQRTTNEDLLWRVELLSKKKAEKKEEPYAEFEDVIVDAKVSAAVAILEAKIKLAEDLEHSRS